MNAKEYLQQIRTTENIINAKLEQCEQLRAMATRTSSNLSSEWTSGGKKTNSRLEDCVVKLISVENGLRYDVYKLAAMKRDAIKKIDAVKNGDYRLLLTLRYINGLTWEKIAVEMNYSWQHLHKMHSKALAMIKID